MFASMMGYSEPEELEEDELEEEELEDEDDEEEEEEVEKIDPAKLAELCGKCKGLCCKYYTVIIDEPEDADDFDELRWFLAHKNNYIYLDEGDWHLNVASDCRFLGDEGRCNIYEHRPSVCRDFGHKEECEFTGDFDFDRVFRSLKDLEAYAKEVLEPQEYAELEVFPEDYDGPC